MRKGLITGHVKPHSEISEKNRNVEAEWFVIKIQKRLDTSCLKAQCYELGKNEYMISIALKHDNFGIMCEYHLNKFSQVRYNQPIWRPIK